MTEPDSSKLARALRLVDFRRLPKRMQTVVTILASVLFAAGAVLAWQRLGTSVAEMKWWPAVGVLLTAPLPLILSAIEFRITAEGLGDHVDARTAVQVAVLGYAANFLPIPGGTILRISTLSGNPDLSARRSTHSTVTVGGFWLAVASLSAGAGLFVLGAAWVGLVLLAASLAALTFSGWGAARLHPRPSTRLFVSRILAVEVLFIVVAAVRTYLAFLVFGLAVPPLAALVVATSSALSTAVGIAPSGLGLREGIAAVLAGAAGISPSAGFLASALLRIAGVVAAGAISVATALWKRTSDSKGDPAAGES